MKWFQGFKISEMFSNDSGKTSMSAFIGFIVVVIGLLCFLIVILKTMFIHDPILLTNYITLAGICFALITTGVGLILGRKIKQDDIAKVMAQIPDGTVKQTIESSISTTTTNP